MILCDYGCKTQANYKFKNGKWCCNQHYMLCPNSGKRMAGENNISHRKDVKKKKYLKLMGHFVSDETKKKISKARKGQTSPRKGIKLTEETKKKISDTRKHRKVANGKNNPNYGNVLTIRRIKKLYPFFSKIEEMRYNPDKSNEKEIQVHCKNHNCENSWFTPTYIQLYERIRSLEKIQGSDGAYYYCSDKCKNECPLYNLRSDYKIKVLYTQSEYQTFRLYVLERDKYKCQYCEEKAEHVHHERPQKLEPFHALDPDLAWSCCSKCHYKKGHKDDCSTGKLANIICHN